ncbi:MAG: branched-chain amino acid ABC transporter substrate-binding protein [Candidatus Edwardsbacteria bacterium]
MNKKFYLFSFIFFLLLSCVPSEREHIRLGVAGPLTGDQGKSGQDILHGVELAVQEWNEQGGVLGKKIVIVAGDDKHDSHEAVLIAKKLLSEKVVGVIGHLNSDCSITASDIYHQAGIPQISPSSTNPIFTERGLENVFRTCGRDDEQGKIAAEFAQKILKAKRIAIIHDRTTYGEGLAEEFKKAISDSSTIISYIGIEQRKPSYAEDLLPLKDKNLEVVYFAGVYPEGIVLVNEIKLLGLKANFVGGDALYNSVYLKKGGLATEGTFFTFGSPVEKIPTAGHFYGKFRLRYGEVGPYSIYAYDATNIILQAIKETGSSEGKIISRRIHQMKYQGALGELKFDTKGDIFTAPYIIWTVKNGEFVPLGNQR